MKLLQNPSSFRDPSGHVYKYNNRIIRVIKKYGKKRYEFIKENNLIEESIKNNFLIDTKEIENEFRNLKSENFCYFLEHERLDYISYPYEWGFYQLKEAALHHLKFQIFLLEKNAILIDSSAFNIQFKNNKPIFIDVLSIDEYIDGDYWNGHNQFLQQFLNPLLLSSLKGISFNDWYKGNLDGIKTTDLNNLLNLKDKLSFNVFFSVVLLSKLEKQNTANPKEALKKINKKRKLSKNSYRSLLLQLKKWIEKLHPLPKKTVWDSYSVANTYNEEQERGKIDIIKKFAEKHKPNLMADIGCNDGLYSFESLKSGCKKVVGFDIDTNAIDRAYKNSLKFDLNFLPLYFNATNPSGRLGWFENERESFIDRLNFDAVIALAFEHHLALANNVPLEDAVKWIIKIAKKGLIEYVSKKDETVKKMLSIKGDIFPDYNQENFEKSILLNGKIINKTKISNTRILYEFEKN
ncbi:50S ribosomal protein L11 methyltransferase [Candidatus Pelagibacter sp.]|nr:50S ribosomal protein L11 methyltransferase [Candidatus Pelagibacter sp.]